MLVVGLVAGVVELLVDVIVELATVATPVVIVELLTAFVEVLVELATVTALDGTLLELLAVLVTVDGFDEPNSSPSSGSSG